MTTRVGADPSTVGGAARLTPPVVTWALLTSPPAISGVATTVIVAFPSAGIVPSEQVNGRVGVHVPWVVVTESSRILMSGVSFTVTSGAGPGPKLVTTRW